MSAGGGCVIESGKGNGMCQREALRLGCNVTTSLRRLFGKVPLSDALKRCGVHDTVILVKSLPVEVIASAKARKLENVFRK